jgi:phosphinothricin acetyltransferase
MTTRIRLATPADGPALARIYRPAVTDSATSFELEPPDAVEMASRVAKVLERTPWLVCEMHEQVVGYAYAGRHRDRPAYQWSVEVSAYVSGDVRRAGVGRGLYASLFTTLALQGFRNAYAGVTLPNPGSIALHTAVGFTPIGVFREIGFKHGAWHDVGWFERQLSPRDASPGAPVPLPEIRDAGALQRAYASGEGLIRSNTVGLPSD